MVSNQMLEIKLLEAECALGQIRSDLAYIALMQALYSFEKAIAKANYNPNQPRIPSGHPNGGQWTQGEVTEQIHLSEPSNLQRLTSRRSVELIADIVSLLPQGRALRLWTSFYRIASRSKWLLGLHKSPKRWANQILKRGWTPDEINETIANGEKFPAPNRIAPENTATRYENRRTGRFLVADDKTGEILQIGDKDFDRTLMPPQKTLKWQVNHVWQ